MGLFSILPDWLSAVEIWVARLCLALAIIIIGPWLLALLYDLVLYIFRTVHWELYGRFHGEHRPRAPSLTERADGHRRQISLPRIELLDAKHGEKADATNLKPNASQATSRASFQLADDAGS